GRGQGEGLKIRIDLRPSPGASRRPLPEGEGPAPNSFTLWRASVTCPPVLHGKGCPLPTEERRGPPPESKAPRATFGCRVPGRTVPGIRRGTAGAGPPLARARRMTRADLLQPRRCCRDSRPTPR